MFVIDALRAARALAVEPADRHQTLHVCLWFMLHPFLARLESGLVM